MAVTLTPSAARHVNRYLGKRGKGVGVRLGVKTTGCSGLAYKLEYVDEFAPEDVVFEDQGVKVLVDPKSLAYIDGTRLDFVGEHTRHTLMPPTFVPGPNPHGPPPVLLGALGPLMTRTAAEVADVALWAVSDAASYVHGTVIDAAGGR